MKGIQRLAVVMWIIVSCGFAYLLVLDVVWATYTNISAVKFFHYFVNRYLAFFILALLFIPKTRSQWTILFDWKSWLMPCLFVAVFSLTQWQFNPAKNITTLLGHRWMWSSIITWTLLFFSQLFLYQKKNVPKVLSFCLSVYGIMLAGTLYEIPHFFRFGVLTNYLLELKFNLSLVVILAFLFNQQMKPKKLVFLISTLFPTVAMFLFYYQLPFWFHRLTVFPFFLSIPLIIQKRGDDK